MVAMSPRNPAMKSTLLPFLATLAFTTSVLAMPFTSSSKRIGDSRTAVVAAMEHVKDKCRRGATCKSKVEGTVEQWTVTFENDGGRYVVVIDKDGKLLKRTDEEAAPAAR
jgi:hypothetical protein